jgi:hypothetical protein
VWKEDKAGIEQYQDWVVVFGGRGAGSAEAGSLADHGKQIIQRSQKFWLLLLFAFKGTFIFYLYKNSLNVLSPSQYFGKVWMWIDIKSKLPSSAKAPAGWLSLISN